MENIILVVVNIQDVPEIDCHRFESKRFPEKPKLHSISLFLKDVYKP